jgi:GNAT superfamily N-acetyltransferase
MSNLPAIKIIPVAAAHFQQVARLHAEGIKEGFLSTLGIRFLAVLYKGIANAAGSGVLVAVEGDRCLGFIAYARDVKACYKQVLKLTWPSLMMAMLPNAVNPSIYKKAFETLLYPFLRRDAVKEGIDEKTGGLRPELLSMAVAEDARDKGIGKLLVQAVDEEMRRMDVAGYYVVTHGVDERANGFYQRCGFAKTHEFVSHGKPMNEYYKTLR